MKARYVLVLAMALIFAGCGDKESSSSEEKAVNEIEDMKQSMEEASKQISKYTSEDLKKATPLSNDKLKAFLPETIDGMKRKRFNIG